MQEVRQVLDAKEGQLPFGIHVMVAKNSTVFLADTTVNERPSAEDLAVIATQTAAVARRLGHEPRVAFLSASRPSAIPRANGWSRSAARWRSSTSRSPASNMKASWRPMRRSIPM